MISIVSYVFWGEKSIPYVYKTLEVSIDGPGPRPCPYMGIVTDILKFNKGVVQVIDFNVFWDEKSIPYVYKTLKSSLDGPGLRPCPYMGIITDILKFNNGFVQVIDFNVFWDEKSIPYVYKTLKSSIGGTSHLTIYGLKMSKTLKSQVCIVVHVNVTEHTVYHYNRSLLLISES